MFGLEIPEPMDQPPGALHAPARMENGVLLEIDNEYLASFYNAGVRSKEGAALTIITLLNSLAWAVTTLLVLRGGGSILQTAYFVITRRYVVRPMHLGRM